MIVSLDDLTSPIVQGYKGREQAKKLLKGAMNCPDEVKRFTALLGELSFFSEGNAIRYPEQADFWQGTKEKINEIMASVVEQHHPESTP